MYCSVLALRHEGRIYLSAPWAEEGEPWAEELEMAQTAYSGESFELFMSKRKSQTTVSSLKKSCDHCVSLDLFLAIVQEIKHHIPDKNPSPLLDRPGQSSKNLKNDF